MLSHCQLLLSDFKRNRPGLLGCEILFRILALALLGPVIAWIVGQLIALSGHAAISNVEIADFLLAPLGCLTLVIFIGLGWAMTFLGQSALLLIQIGRLSDMPQSPTRATIAVVRRAPVIIELALIFVVMFLLVASPFLVAVSMIYRWLLSDFDINYYLSERPFEFWLALVLAGIPGIGLVITWSLIYARTLYALPECVLNLQRPVMALRRSYEMTRDHVRVVFNYLIGWFIVYLFVSVLITIGVQGIEYLSMQAAGESFAAVALVIGLLLTLNLVAGTLVTIFGNLSQSLLIGRLYWSALNKVLPMSPAQNGLPCPELPGITAANTDDDSDVSTLKSTWFTTKRVVLVSVLLVAFSSLGFCLFVAGSLKQQDEVYVTAHRGSSKEAPENTLSAIRQAITDKADLVEIDVQETSDGVVIVMHDADLMRISGQRQNIWDTSFEALRKMDAGLWFSDSFADERVPTLQEVIDVARGKIKVNIELKFNGHDEQLISRTLNLVRENDFDSQCVISSLNHDCFGQVRAIVPGVRVGAIVGASIGDLSQIDADFISINVQQVNRGLIRDLHRQGKEIHVWTVNDVKTMSDMIDLRVDNILTDEPRKLIRVLDERQGLSETERLLLAFRELIEY